MNSPEYTKNYRKTHKKEIEEYRRTHKEEMKELSRLNHLKNKIERNKRSKQWRKEHKSEMREYYLIHKNELKKYRKEYNRKNKAKILKQTTLYRLLHKDEISKRDKKYRKINKEKIAEYGRNRLKTDIDFRILHGLRSRIWDAIRRNYKSARTIELLGCSIADLKNYLNKQFSSSMSWDNYGKWHIDHIKPCASFDLSKPEEQHKCFHYTNLQPLWAKDNLSKGKKYQGGNQRAKYHN